MTALFLLHSYLTINNKIKWLCCKLLNDLLIMTILRKFI